MKQIRIRASEILARRADVEGKKATLVLRNMEVYTLNIQKIELEKIIAADLRNKNHTIQISTITELILEHQA